MKIEVLEILITVKNYSMLNFSWIIDQQFLCQNYSSKIPKFWIFGIVLLILLRSLPLHSFLILYLQVLSCKINENEFFTG